jgi:hypothetical protein|tara:strand:+ start:722 stop:1150 length:429 start_codon:yes stop_codon:yes gene_type:complete
MTLEELQELADKDIKLNDTELDLESLKTPAIHNKYCKFHNKFNTLLKQAEDQLSVLRKEKWEYFTGKADPSVYQAKPFNLKILRQDVDKYINADEEIIKASQKVSYLRTTVDYLDRLIRQIANRTFTIKNAIDWRKFTSGAI